MVFRQNHSFRNGIQVQYIDEINAAAQKRSDKTSGTRHLGKIAAIQDRYARSCVGTQAESEGLM